MSRDWIVKSTQSSERAKVGQRKTISFEDRLPYIASAITGVLSYLLTLSYLNRELGAFFILVLVATGLLVFADFNLWSFYGALLVGFILETISKAGFESASGLVVLFLCGTIVSLFIEWWRGETLFGGTPSIMRNVFFAIVGGAIGFVLTFLITVPFLNVTEGRDLSQVGQIIVLVCVTNPLTFGVLFSALSQVGFDISSPKRIAGRVFTTLVVLTALVIPLQLLTQLLPPEYEFFEIIAVLFLFFGIGWGATLGDQS